MESICRGTGFFSYRTRPIPYSFSRPNKFSNFVCFSKTSSPPRLVEEEYDDVLRMFLKDRQLNADFISKASDFLYLLSSSSNSITTITEAQFDAPPQSDDRSTVTDDYDADDGFLKLTQAQEWIFDTSDNSTAAPLNKKLTAKAMRDDRDRRKKMNFLQYEAIKRELLLLSVTIGTACTGYCLVAFSFQAAISYATGVLFSCLYLQLLYRHADNLSRETVPHVFMQKKSKRIGIRSEDLNSFFERTFKGSGMALSSPRLVIPAAIYGLWALSHQNFTNDFFDFQIVPAIFGMLVYKAAALVQVYRDNEDLQIILPDSIGGSSD